MAQTPQYTYKIINTFPHDHTAYCQGLVVEGDIIYESTGLEGGSSLRKLELNSAALLNILPLPGNIFGEGITILNDKIYQLTWQNNVGYIYQKSDFSKIGEFYYGHEGWGITNNGKILYVSDGSNIIHLYSPDNLNEIGTIEVYDGSSPVYGLNELEFVEGEIYANVLPTNYIVRISPETGEVLGRIDLSGILGSKEAYKSVEILNGIAYDPNAKRLFVTGKFWPKLFEIEILPIKSSK